MINLDNLTEIKSLDKGFALDSISKFPNQCLQAFEETKEMVFSDDYEKVKNIVIAGMGGSAYPGRIIKTLFLKSLKKPVELITGYDLPDYVNQDSLVFLSSFSGTTEETLAIGEKAKKRGARIAGISSGSKLATFLKENNYPSYIFKPKHNPSNQPRLGQGYMVIGTIMLFRNLGIIPLEIKSMQEAINFVKENDQKFSQATFLNRNFAKRIAFDCLGRYPILISGDIFEGVLHAVRNPFNETAKQFAAYFSIPELNHHLMEGFSFPKDNQEKLLVILFESPLYEKRISQRMEITKDVLKKNLINFVSFKLEGKDILSQGLELLQWGSYVSFYLGMLNHVDPSKIPWVDYFKKCLWEMK